MQNSNSIIVRSIRHITDNFEVFGFTSSEVSFLQCAKEMLDNSIDAIRLQQKVENRPFELSVIVSSHYNSIDMIFLEVQDDGCGIRMCNPEEMVECFTSSKAAYTESSVHLSGKYGVGLSAALLYSQLHTNQPMRIISKMATQMKAKVIDFKFDETTGIPNIMERKDVVEDSLKSGTIIRISLPAVNKLQQIYEALEIYLSRFNILPTTQISVVLLFELPNFQKSLKHIAKSEDIHLPDEGGEDNDNDNGDGNESHYASQLHENLVEYLANENNATLDVVTSLAESYDYTVRQSVVLSFIDSRHYLPVGGDSNNENSLVIPVQIWRYANGIPLLDFDNDALSCLSTHCIRTFKWSQFGLCIKPNKPTTSGDTTLLQPPALTLQSIRDDMQSLSVKPKSCIIIIDIIASSIPFANTRKSAISHNKVLQTLLKQALTSCMTKLQARHGELLLSKSDYQEYNRHRLYIPQVAKSIANILQNSNRPSFQRNCLSLMPALTTSSLHGEELSTFICQQLLGICSSRDSNRNEITELAEEDNEQD